MQHYSIPVSLAHLRRYLFAYALRCYYEKTERRFVLLYVSLSLFILSQLLRIIFMLIDACNENITDLSRSRFECYEQIGEWTASVGY